MQPTVNDLLEYSYKNELAHIPSALSMYNYLYVLFDLEIVKKDDIIVLGKPFGAQAYYLIWKELGWLDNIEELSVGVKHDEIEFVDYSEETIGNALGVAIGLALANPEKRVWVNITDATLQMGNTLEAIQYIGQHSDKFKNLLLTVDDNNSQVTGETDDIINIDATNDFFVNCNWEVVNIAEGYSPTILRENLLTIKNDGWLYSPLVIFFSTIKGGGVPYMERNPKEWHYKKLTAEYMI